MLAVETQDLTKRFGSFESLKECTLQVREGSVLGLLGPNGAGKSTLIRTLLGFLQPTSGSASVLGHDVKTQSLDIRRKVAYLPGDARLYRGMRGRSVIDLFAQMHPCGDRTESIRVAEELNLDTSRRVAFMSTGMRQKLALSIVLGCQAPLLILDEPTANLDPDVRREVLELVKKANQSGRTVLLSSHLFSDIESTCSEIALLRGGQIVATEQLTGRSESHIVTGWVRQDREDAVKQHIQRPFVKRHRIQATSDGNDQRLAVTLELVGDPNDWMPWLAADIQLRDIVIRRAGIEAFYERFATGSSAGAAAEATA
ncbi:MAG: ATP-binding cassette domain-containing protein [Aureliella sp.]